MADVDAVNERLNGLVTLLQAVGVGANMDPADIARLGKGMNGGGGGDMGISDARQLNDDQVEALIRKLQQAQAEAPQIIAALEAHAEARSLTGGKPSKERQRQQPQQQRQQQPQEEEEEEDDSEYDDDANYPMVGHGCSDEISVVSDLTTPTVVSNIHVHEEEHYRDILPPMIIGGGSSDAPPMMINPTKRKNLVSQVRPSSGIAPPPRRNVAAPPRAGGAAASRRKNYQETMARLHDNPHSAGVTGPSNGGPTRRAPPQPQAPPPRKVAPQPQQSPAPAVSSAQKKRVPRPSPAPQLKVDNFNMTANNFSELANSSKSKTSSTSWDNGWNSFESKPPTQRRAETTVDNDGFLVGDGGFDPFSGVAGGTSNPFKSSAGDLAFSSDFDAFANVNSSLVSRGSSTASKPRIKRPESNSMPPSSARIAPTSSQLRKGIPAPPGGASSSSQPRPRRTRRASLAT
jgi:hypothetical protein